MWWILLAIFLASVWLLGVLAALTFGGFIHVLLVMALASLILRLLRGRPAR